MSERYTRLCVLPENLYAAGSPVLLSAGALLKDNQSGRILAQLKLRSLSPVNIKAVKVSVRPFDTVGAPLGEAVEHQYLDLTAARGDEFGAKSPIVLPDAATRAFSAVVTEVAFADNRVWHASGAPWEPLPVPQPLEAALDDAELVKQFRMTYGADCVCLPMEHKDLWYCACGARNRREEAVCHRCGREHAALAAIDLDALRAERDARLAEEAEQAEAARLAAEEAARIRAKKAKKTAKIASIIATVIALVAAAYFVVTKVVIPNSEYNAAVDLMEAGQYFEAIAAFEAMDGYKDSAEQITECKYLYAATLLESGQLNEAMILFRALGNYKDSVDQVSECQYRGATNHMEDKNWSVAASMFQNLGAYKDSADQANECNYCLATDHMQNKSWSEAAQVFKTLGTYKDSKEQLAACQTAIKDEEYDAAVKLLNAGKDWKAYDAFVALGTYKDSKTQANTILNEQYKKVLADVSAYVDKGEYSAAVNRYKNGWNDAFYLVSGYSELVNNYNYALMCRDYEGKRVKIFGDYLSALSSLPTTFRDVSKRLGVIAPYVGLWKKANSSYAVQIGSDSRLMRIGYIDGENDFHPLSYYSLHADLKNGAITNIQGEYTDGLDYYYTIKLTSAGNLELTEYDEGKYCRSIYNGTYKKVK